MAQAPTAVPVLTWRYDITEQGQNTHETALTPSNVTESNFGKLFSHTVDGAVYAQPLYVPGLTLPNGSVHNVMFIATEHDSVYAFDADNNTGANANPLWHITLLDAAHGAASGATTVPSSVTNQGDISPEIGITSTPVIDTTTDTIYVVGKTAESGGYVQRLHALNILTGAEKTGSPVAIHATVNGTGSGSVSGKLSFDALRENQRPALMLFGGHVYISFASHGDNLPYHGWVLAYNASTLAQTAALCLSPNGYGNSVWASGAGMPIDASVSGGRMYLVTGNGTFATYPPFTAGEFSNSVVAIDLSNGGLSPVDAFTPFNQASLSKSDLDQGSGGVLMLPDQQGSHPHILLQAGKEGRILVLNRDSLGGYAAGATSNTNALQDIPNKVKGLWSTPAYWNGNVYIWGTGDYGSSDTPKLFKLNSGVLDTNPSSVSTISGGHPGGIFSVSSNGTSNGIAWAVRTDGFTSHTDQIVYAFDANDLTKLLWASNTNSTRDSPGQANKFVIPVVTNGKLYVAALKRITVYGLFNGTPVAATPVINPNGGTFSTAQSVTITTTTSSASIYYTLDGTAPTPASTLYTGPITISTNKTLKAIATAPNFVQSATATATFTFASQTPPVTFQPAGGTYSSPQSVTLSDTDTNASIHYTTDGSTPTSSSALYSAPFTVSSSKTIQAIAIDPTLPNSSVTSASYVIQTGGGGATINFANGFSSTTGLTLNGNAVNTNDTKLALTTGATAQKGSVFWSQPVGINSFTTDFTFQITNPQADGMTFTIQNVGNTALGGAYAGLGYASIGKSVAIKFDLYNNAGEGADSTGVFTNGATPTVPALDMTSSGVNLHSGDPMLGHVTYDGTTLTMNLSDQVTHKAYTLSKAINIPQTVGASTAYVGFTGGTGGLASTQKLLNWTYTTPLQSPGTAAPTFSPAPGNYTTTQNVTLSDTTTGAVIYYTTDGSTPTTSSTVYSSPIAIGSGSTTIKAFAVASGSTASAVVSATYVIGAATADPTFNPSAGSYATPQSVTLSDTTSGATIYYTSDGTTPTTSSTPYTGPITVGSGTTTIKAIAVASGFAASNVVSATYMVGTPATADPSFNPAGGNYATAQSVALSDTTSGATIYYTTDGTTPTTSSTVYSSPITVGDGTTTIKAFAVASGSAASNVVSATYIVGTPPPTFSPAGGTYTATQNVTLSDAASGATIYYTTDGSAPTTSSSVYSSPIPVGNGTTTLNAIAVANSQTSTTASATYTIQPGTMTPTINYANGFSSAANLSLKAAAAVTSNLLRITLAGSTIVNGAAWYTTPVKVNAFTTDFDFQLLNAKADGFTFTLQNTGVSALGPGGSGLGYGASQPNGTPGIGRSVAIKFDLYNNDGEGTDSTGFYTNGASPTIPAIDMTASQVLLNSGHVLHAHITYDGTNLTLLLTDTTTSASFTTKSAINIPGIVGSGTAFAGFTGGIGGFSMTTDILNWTYTEQ